MEELNREIDDYLRRKNNFEQKEKKYKSQL